MMIYLQVFGQEQGRGEGGRLAAQKPTSI